MDSFVFPLQPSGKGSPDIIDTGDLTGTEEVLFYETDRVFNRTLAFRIRFVADPEFQILFRAEVFKDPGPDHFSIGLAGNENCILVNDQDSRTASDPAECPVDRLACFCGIIFMILCVHTKQSAIPKKEAYEMDRLIALQGDFPKVNEHLLSRRCVKHMVIDPFMITAGIDLAGLLQKVNIVSEGLLVAGQFIIGSVFNERFFQDIVDG